MALHRSTKTAAKRVGFGPATPTTRADAGLANELIFVEPHEVNGWLS